MLERIWSDILAASEGNMDQNYVCVCVYIYKMQKQKLYNCSLSDFIALVDTAVWMGDMYPIYQIASI